MRRTLSDEEQLFSELILDGISVTGLPAREHYKVTASTCKGYWLAPEFTIFPLLYLRHKNNLQCVDAKQQFFLLLAEEIPFVQGSLNQYLKVVYRNVMFLLPPTPDEIRLIIHN